MLPKQAQCFIGDLTRADTLSDAVDGIDAVAFTHGANGGKSEAERVDYGGVRNIVAAMRASAANGTRIPRIALMTAIGVTNRQGAYNRATEIHDWKRRGERLLRASGLPYTIVRPGWFDYNAQDQQRLLTLQGDKRQAGDPSDGVVSRRQIAQVLVASFTSDAALGKTFELVAEHGAATTNLEVMFAALAADEPGSLDGVWDAGNMPLTGEPASVRNDLQTLTAAADARGGQAHAKLQHAAAMTVPRNLQ